MFNNIHAITIEETANTIKISQIESSSYSFFRSNYETTYYQRARKLPDNSAFRCLDQIEHFSENSTCIYDRFEGLQTSANLAAMGDIDYVHL